MIFHDGAKTAELDSSHSPEFEQLGKDNGTRSGNFFAVTGIAQSGFTEDRSKGYNVMTF